MNATLKMWGPVIIIIVIEHTMKYSRSVVNADWEYFVDSVSEIKSILSFVFHAIYGAVSRGCMYSAYPFLLWWLWEYVYFILLSSSNRKYDPFPIA